MTALRFKAKRGAYRAARLVLARDAARRGLTFGIGYHRFESAPGADPDPGMAITTDRFARHLDWLNEVGSVISIDEALSDPGRPGIRFFLSFDDGYRDNADLLPGLLQQAGMPCCLFVTAGWVRGDFDRLEHDRQKGYDQAPMSEQDLQTLARTPGITIGSHSLGHPDLATLEVEALARELTESRQWLEEVTGREVAHFAIPFGQPRHFPWAAGSRAVREAGYRSVVSNYGGANGPDRADVLEHGALSHLRRVPAPNTGDRDVFLGWVLGLCNLRERLRPVRRLGL